MTDITIPPGALEAAAKELYEQERDLGGRPLPSWSDAGRKTKERFYKAARAACLAMIRNWPGMFLAIRTEEGGVEWDNEGGAPECFVLPLQAKEGGDDQAKAANAWWDDPDTYGYS